jgi:hypothetical protein
MWFATRSYLGRMFIRHLAALFALGSVSLVNTACGGRRVSGTYISREPTSASMLQLTQADNAQVTGVLSWIELNADGKLSSDQAPITSGTIDSGQLTLTLHSGLLGKNVSGTVRWNTITLQAVGSNGEVLTWHFVRSSPEDFKKCADQLRGKAEGVMISARLVERARRLHQAIEEAESWMANAKLHAQQIPAVKNYYQKLEDQMRSLLVQERATRDSVARSQISVEINQLYVAGAQADVQGNQMWDQAIGERGRSLSGGFASLPPDCGTPKELQQRDVTPQVLRTWQSACQHAVSARAKFDPVFKRIRNQRDELRTFQIAAQSHRQVLVREAERIQ